MFISGMIGVRWRDGGGSLWGDGVTARLSKRSLRSPGEGATVWRKVASGERSLPESGGVGRALAATGGAERLLASTGRAGGVSRIWSSWSTLGAADRLLRWLDCREDPCWEAGGSCRGLLDVLHERLGETSGEESSISVTVFCLALGIFSQGQDASGQRTERSGLIKGRLESSAGLAYLSEPKK